MGRFPDEQLSTVDFGANRFGPTEISEKGGSGPRVVVRGPGEYWAGYWEGLNRGKRNLAAPLVRMLKGQLLSRSVRVMLLVEEIQWVGEVKKWADTILVKNDHVEKQLHSKLVHLFGVARPHWAQKIRRHRSHHETVQYYS